MRGYCDTHVRYTPGCEPCRVATSERYNDATRTEPVVPLRKPFCICGCGQPVPADFYSYASTECMFKGRKR